MGGLRWQLLIVPAVLIAGCLGPQGGDAPGGPGQSPEGIPLPSYIENGSWVAFAVDARPGFGYSWVAKSQTDYRNYEVREEDAFDCEVAATGDGWSRNLPISHRDTASSYFAVRNDAERRWAGSQYADVGAAPGVMYLGAPNHEPGLKVLLANETVGPGVSSWLRLNDSSEPVSQLAKGKFWCLSGLSRFDEGNYVVSNDFVDAQSLGWRVEITQGILIRVKASADQGSWRLTGPDRTTYDGPQLAPGNTTDETFCSPEIGTWFFEVPLLRSSAGKPWELTVLVFDIGDPSPPCGKFWETSSLF
jgi:hypothetical protein